MTEKKRKTCHGIFKVAAVVASCAFPLYSVYEHFPYWQYEYGAARSLGSGAIISAIILALIFRKTVFNYVSEKIKGRNAPPMTIWISGLVITYILIYINAFLVDLTSVLWMGLIGSLVGTLLNYIADNKFGGENEGT